MTVLQLSLRLLLFIAAGFLGRKLRVMPDGFDKMLSRFVLAIPLPCMIVDSFRIEYSADNLLIVPKIVLLALGSLAFMFVVVFLATMWMKDAAMKKTVRFALLFTNFTFMGFAVVQELFGPDGFFNYVIFTLPIRVIFYGGASLMLGKKGEKLDGRETLRRFLCEPVIAVFIGFFLYAFRIELPAVLSSTIQSIAKMQFCVCTQAGIYLPDEFITDVLVATDLDKSVKCSNFIGDTIDMAKALGFSGMLLTGHIGKLIKVSGGIMNTHSKEGDCRMELLAAAGLKAGCDADAARAVLETAVTEEGIRILKEAGCCEKAMDYVMERILFFLRKRGGEGFRIECMTYCNQYGLLAKSEGAEDMLSALMTDGKIG